MFAPWKVERRFRPHAWALFFLLLGCLVGYCAYDIVQIEASPRQLRHTIEGADAWGALPNISLCHKEDFPVRWAFVSTWIYRGEFVGYEAAAASPTDGVENALDVEITNRFWPEQTNLLESCLCLDSSVMRPVVKASTLNEVVLYIHVLMEVPDGLGDAWKTIEVFADNAGTSSSLGHTPEPSPLNGSGHMGALFPLSKTRRFDVHGNAHIVYASSAEVVAIGPLDLRRRWVRARPHPGLNQRYVSNISTPDSQSLKVLFVGVGIAHGHVETLTEVTKRSQVLKSIGTTGGYFAIVTVIWSVLFVRKYPVSQIAATYEIQTVCFHDVWDTSEVVVDPDEESFYELFPPASEVSSLSDSH